MNLGFPEKALAGIKRDRIYDLIAQWEAKQSRDGGSVEQKVITTLTEVFGGG